MSAKIKNKSKSKSKPKVKTCRDVGFKSIKRRNRLNGHNSKIMTSVGVLSTINEELDRKLRLFASTEAVDPTDLDQLKKRMVNAFTELDSESSRVKLKTAVFDLLAKFHKLRSGEGAFLTDLEGDWFLNETLECFRGFDELSLSNGNSFDGEETTETEEDEAELDKPKSIIDYLLQTIGEITQELDSNTDRTRAY